VPSRQRGALMAKFKEDPKCQVFLSTDAGGVGLNLQAASAVVNFEPPWNPARLEQRIGRVHRLGQSRPVDVVHMLTEDSIEERVWETLRLKKSLFASVFDSPAAEVSFAKLGRKSGLQAIKEILADQPEKPKPPVESRKAAPKNSPQAAAAEAGSIGTAAARLIEAGVGFMQSLASNGDALSSLFTQDPRTKRTVLSIPLSETVGPRQLTAAISSLLNAFGTIAARTGATK